MMVWTGAAEAGILERIEAPIAGTAKGLYGYIKAHAEFVEIGNGTPTMGVFAELNRWQQIVEQNEDAIRAALNAPLPEELWIRVKDYCRGTISHVREWR